MTIKFIICLVSRTRLSQSPVYYYLLNEKKIVRWDKRGLVKLKAPYAPIFQQFKSPREQIRKGHCYSWEVVWGFVEAWKVDVG